MKVFILASLLLAASAARAADMKKAASDKPKLRSSLTLAYAMAYAASELLMAAEATYSIACNKPESHTTLMMIDKTLTRALAQKKDMGAQLAAAAAAATPDAAAHDVAVRLDQELSTLSTVVARTVETASSCAAFMSQKDNAAVVSNDLTWNAARLHAGMNGMRLKDLDTAAELKTARTLVEKTK